MNGNMGGSMKHLEAIARGFGAALFLAAGVAMAQDPGNWDGLVEVKPKRLDAVFLLPGADFRAYTKVMMDPVEVAFEKDWARDYNRDAATLSQRLDQTDLDRITKAARDAFTKVFTEQYRKAGLELVTEPGPDVLRLRPGVVNLYITAPDQMTSGRSRTYTMESGHATLFLEARDSTTGALLGRALDKRATRNTGRIQISSSVTNLADFEALFRQWADISVKGFEELRERSPVPADLKPGQKLQD
jgi:Protein of unknown function (DUF3313)